jgi:HK97 gp10 family phage protein
MFNKSDLTGVEELIRMIDKFEKVPASVLTKATKAGAMVVRTQARQLAPGKTPGKLRTAIKLKAEKRKTGKKVYQVKIVGDGFVKFSKAGKRSFYPASQEYGWKHMGKTPKIPGKYYLTKAIQQNKKKIEQLIVDIMTKALKAIRG